VIDPTLPFEVQVDWKVFGILVPLWLTALDQEFVVSVYAEGMGASPEIRIGTATKDKDDFIACAGNNCREYSVRVQIPPILTEDAGDESGIYKLVMSVFLNSSIQGGKFDLMGFREGPFIVAFGESQQLPVTTAGERLHAVQHRRVPQLRRRHDAVGAADDPPPEAAWRPPPPG
jgi:hypothetical protein